jgi:hypothetical protein
MILGALWMYLVGRRNDQAKLSSAHVELKHLRNEFRTIKAPKGAVAIKDASLVSRGHAFYEWLYSSDLQYGGIRKFYDLELPKHGWVKTDESRVKDWGRDQGGQETVYLKGKYRAALFRHDKETSIYSLSLSWGSEL